MKVSKNLAFIFVDAVTISAIILGIDTYFSNRAGTNIKEIIVNVIAAILALPLFIIGFKRATKEKSSTWVGLNSLAILVIVGWTIWISLILYAFKDFHL
jgi:hypothetical protein